MNLILRSFTSRVTSASCKPVSINVPCCFSTKVSGKKNKDYPPNDSIAPVFVNNRNPRNLEKICIGEKPAGWSWEKQGKHFWNKVIFEVTGQHINAKIVHYKGQVPVTASTKEWCIKKFLYSTNDTPAAEAIGTILAHRCIQSGINEVACFFTEEDKQKEKVKVFIKALEEGGMTLSEPDQNIPPCHLITPVAPEKAWTVHEDMNEELIKKIELVYKKS